jgi:hypothetical protein
MEGGMASRFEDTPWSELSWRERAVLIAVAPFVLLISAAMLVGLAAFCLIPLAALAILTGLVWRVFS